MIVAGLDPSHEIKLETAREMIAEENSFKLVAEKWIDLPTIVQSLQAIRGRLAERRLQFLASARAIGSDAYGSLLSGESGAWSESQRRYGLGAGYKRDVATIWRVWFETSEAAHATARAVHERLQDAWIYGVIDPLRQSLESDGGEG